QNDVERVHGMTAAVLDRMHRILRLQRHLAWSLPELDLVLVHVHTEGLGAGIDASGLDTVARIQALARRLTLDAAGAVALWSTLPQTAVSAGEPALFERIFSPKPLLDPAAPLP